jgi:signal transduction histidine kinase
LIGGAIYAVAGFFSVDCDEDVLPHWGRAVYVIGLTALLGEILFTSRLAGQIYLCVYPAAAVALTLLSPFAAVVAEAIIVSVLVAAVLRFSSPDWALRNFLSILAGYAFVVVFTLSMIRSGRARREAERLSRELAQANQRLQAQAARMAAVATLEERNRLAREIHDGLGHYLTTIHVQLEAAQALQPADPDRALAAVVKAHGLARDALLEVRRSVSSLRADRPPPALVVRLQDLVASVNDPLRAAAAASGAGEGRPPPRGTGLAVQFEVLGDPRPLAPEAELGLFRAAQEGLTNVRKHAAATQASVIIDFRETDRVALRVVDDGRGCANPAGGHGLAGLAERLALLGGEIRANNAPAGGFRLEAALPVPAGPAAGAS